MFGQFWVELPAILSWNLVFLLMGIAVMPFMQKFFGDWRDGGYGVSKFIGFAVVTLPLWLLASLRIMPFTQSTSLFFFIALLAGSAFFIYKTKFRISRSKLKWIIIEELIFFTLFMVWVMIRSTNSQAEGTEKMMNIAFMNSIFRSEYFPVADPWYQGATINYYHIGHYMFTFVAKMIGVKISFAYNLALTTIIAFSFTAVFSIIIRLLNSAKAHFAVLAGFFGAIWMCFGSNLHYIYVWLQAIAFNKPFEYWFPDGTRIISNAIDEFPAYSIVLGDLHGHYLGMPFFIVALAILFAAYKIDIKSKLKVRFNLVVSIFVWSLFGINSWDFITVNFLFVLLHGYQAFSRYENKVDALIVFVMNEAAILLPGAIFFFPYINNFHPPVGGIGIVTSRSDILQWMQMWGGFIVITLTFIYTRALAKSSKFFQIMSLMGIGLVVASRDISRIKPFFIDKTNESGVNIFQRFSDMFQLQASPTFWQSVETSAKIILLIALFVTVVMIATKFIKKKLFYIQGKDEAFVYILSIAVFCLLIGVEIIFVKDIFYFKNPAYFRANTMFKFYYHAWIMWSIILGYYMYQIMKTFLGARGIGHRIIGALITFVSMFVFVGSALYIVEAVRDFYPFMKPDSPNLADQLDARGNAIVTPTQTPVQQTDVAKSTGIGDLRFYTSIDGNWYIRNLHKGDYGAIEWIRENVKGQPVIVEAVGDAYTYYARYSANTGLINVVGWPSHEWQWRLRMVEKRDANGKVIYKETGEVEYDDPAWTEIEDRGKDVDKVYTTQSESELKDVLIKYDVDYVVFGELESEKYKNLNEELVKKIGAKVYDQDNTRLYKIRLD